MRRIDTRRSVPWAVVASLLVFTLVGAGTPGRKSETYKVEETLADLAFVRQSETQVEGIGLVIGLDGTGANAPPSTMRSDLVEEMRKAGVDHPEQWLERKDVSMVMVRGRIASGVNASDRFDVDIELPPGCATTSLAGGHLLITQLRQVVNTPNQGLKKGAPLATAGGPMMIGSPEDASNPRKARVLGGGRVKSDVPFTMIVKEDRRSGRTVKLIEEVIRRRFHQSDGVNLEGMATGKTDSILVLKVPKVYHHNQARYFQLLQLLPVVQTTELQADRLDKWAAELQDPKLAGRAALKLEGMGTIAASALQLGLNSKDPQVRFFAAESLAYLGNPAGVEVLAQTAIERKEFRNPALRALGASDQAAALMKLRNLLSEADTELRYGAFDTLRTADPTDPFLGRVAVYDEPEEEEDDFALQIEKAPFRRKAGRPEDPFALYIVDSTGPPMVHISRNIRQEIVIFGRDVKLLPPVVLGGGGSILLNAAETDLLVQISRVDSRTIDGRESRLTTPLELATVIRQIAQLGATYPEIVDILTAAYRQKNLPGPLIVDAIPIRSQAYDEAQLLGAAKKDDGVKKASAEEEPKKFRLFGRLRDRMKR